jgi:hypothetical protein
MKKLYFLYFFAWIVLADSCKRDAPIYPGEKGYVADTPPGTGGTGTGGTGTGGTGTGGTGTGGTGTGTGGTGTGGVTPVANGNGLPLGAVGTFLYKVQGVTYTCTQEVSFAFDQKSNAYLTAQADANAGPWACGINLDFVGKAVGTYAIDGTHFFLTSTTITDPNNGGGAEMSLVDGKVAITNSNNDGYLGTLQGTFNANMLNDADNKVYNVIGSFNIKQ